MKKLNNELLAERQLFPTKVIQFGEGNFMRAFVDWQIQQMNKQGLFEGGVAVVQPLEQGLGQLLTAQDNLYTVILEGLQAGEAISQPEIIECLNQVIDPYQNWSAYLALAEDDALELIVSNTTEAGIQYLAEDQPTTTAPQSFPAKLTALLYRRFQLQKNGVTIIPCELIDRNGEQLKEIILRYVDDWQLGAAFRAWLLTENSFCCSLVDRIVPGYPRDSADTLNQQHGYEDQLMVKAEPFMLWVIEGPASLKELLPLQQAGLNVIVTDNMTPYRERKVHLLNGPHTAMVPLGLLAGLTTVENVMEDQNFRPFINQLFTAELIPLLDLPEAELTVYAEQIKERFLNPFAQHQLSAIALNSIAKYRARLLPVFLKYYQQKGSLPPYLTAALAALILLYRGDHFAPQDDEAILQKFATAWANPETAAATILSDSQLWGQDLTQVAGLLEKITVELQLLDTVGARSLLQQINQQYIAS